MVELGHQRGGALSSTGEEAVIAVIRGVVLLNKVANVDFVLPKTGGKTLPCVVHMCFLLSNLYAALKASSKAARY